ncbi:MAG: 6-phosphogluconolactonase, partial [Ignavibacteriaceae bacterium]
HTASIFPNKLELFNSDKVCAVAEHPSTGQKRITLTGKVIKNSKRVIFMITGNEKAEIVKNILEKKKGYEKYPAAYAFPEDGIYEWYIDEKAAKLL